MELEELRKWQNSVEGAARSVETTVRSEIGQFQEAIQVGPPRSATVAFESPHETTAEPTPEQDSPAAPVQPNTASIQSKPDPTQP
jgi:sec-independent protein translocase protein TatB